MAGSNTLKEFLVELGFKVDEKSYKKFKDSVSVADAASFALGETLYDVSKKIETFVIDSSVNLEKLYFASQRVGSGANDIKGFEFAVSRLGGTADDARSSLEGLGSFLRRTPGGGKYLEALGVDAKHVGDANAELQDLAKSFSKLPQSLQIMYGESIGLNERTILSLQRVAHYQQQYSDILKQFGINQNQATDLSNRFNDQLYAISATVDALGVKLFAMLEPTGERTEHLISDVIKLADAFGNLAPTKLFFIGLSTIIDETIEGLDVLVRLLTDIAHLDFTAFKNDLVGGAEDMWKIFKGHSAEVAGVFGQAPPGAPVQATHQRTDSAMAYFESLGWTPAQAAGLVANAVKESQLNPQAVGDGGQAVGVFQWHPDRQAEFRRVFGKDLKDATLNEQFAFKNYELTQGKEQYAGALLRQATTPAQAGFVDSLYDQRPAGGKYEATLRGNMAGQVMAGATINQTTTINVNGGGSAQDTANAIGRQQTQVNNTLIRNVMGNTQ